MNVRRQSMDAPGSMESIKGANSSPNLVTIPGYAYVKRAIEVAVAGHHSIILVGPTEAARQSLALTTVNLYQCFHKCSFNVAITDVPLFSYFPFSSYTNSQLDKACRQYIYVPEITYLPSKTLKTVAMLLETGYPLVITACAKPCPCGNFTDHSLQCSCSTETISLHQNKLNSLKLIDIWVRVEHEPLRGLHTGETMEAILSRLKSYSLPRGLQEIEVSQEALKLLEVVETKSPAQDAAIVLKIARTIAAMEKSHTVEARHVAEAVQYRPTLFLPQPHTPPKTTTFLSRERN